MFVPRSNPEHGVSQLLKQLHFITVFALLQKLIEVEYIVREVSAGVRAFFIHP